MTSFLRAGFRNADLRVSPGRICDMSSPIGFAGGNRGSLPLLSIRECVRWGIVATSGDNAHGFDLDARSCSRVGSMKLQERSISSTRIEPYDPYFMNFSAVLKPHGNLRGRSKVFPNNISSAE